MRTLNYGLFGATALATVVATSGCSNNSSVPAPTTIGGSSSNGGATGNGGSSGVGGASAVCSNATSRVTPCGGNVVGTWNITASCLKVSGDLDVSLVGMACPTFPVTGGYRKVTGTWTANADGTFTDNTVTTGNEQFTIDAKCLTVSSVPTTCSGAASVLTSLGYKSVICTTASSGGCDCSAELNSNPGMGLMSWSALTNGTYTTSGNAITTDAPVSYDYCVSGNTLTMSPQSTQPILTGTTVFQKSGTTGAGGATGTGGQANAGGATGVGGNTPVGGAVGAGGNSTTGGASTAGGNTATGGKAAGGGIATGGASTAGGNTATGGKAAGGGVATGGVATTGGATSAGGVTSTGGATSSTGGGGTVGGATGKGPCDIYGAANTACVAAHSTVRALLGSYSGSLYQVKRASDNTTKDIGVVSTGGVADSAAQDSFCSGTTCVITKVYDQSGKGNLLEAQFPGSPVCPAGTAAGTTRTICQGQTAASATAENLTLNGHKVYSLYTKTSQAYWYNGSKSGMALGNQPIGIYMVTSGTHYNSGCCYDYGNGETTRTYVAGPSIHAVYFGNSTTWGSGAGTGPWIMADMEDGIFAKGGGGNNPSLPTVSFKYTTAITKNNGTTEMALRGGDATAGNLTTYYKGALPPGKNPMKLQGAVLLGSGGDCCYSNNNASQGTFYEGVIVSGYPSDATEESVQANIVSAGYGK